MIKPDELAALSEQMQAASEAYFKEVEAKYGHDRAVMLSEFANLVLLAILSPRIAKTVEELFVHSLSVMQITTVEANNVISRFVDVRHHHQSGEKEDLH